MEFLPTDGITAWLSEKLGLESGCDGDACDVSEANRRLLDDEVDGADITKVKKTSNFGTTSLINNMGIMLIIALAIVLFLILFFLLRCLVLYDYKYYRIYMTLYDKMFYNMFIRYI